jgi:hypothetical protein
MKFKGETIDGSAVLDWQKVYGECEKYHRFVIEIRELDEQREISLQQMKYFHAVVVPLFSEWNGDSKGCWETRLKLECGSKWFTPEVHVVDGKPYSFIPSKKTLSVKDCSEWFQNIMDYGLREGVVVPPPDPEWRKNNECQ